MEVVMKRRQNEENPWSLSDAMADRLGLSGEKRAEFARRYAKWEESLGPVEEAFKRSEAVTQEDLAIRINVRASD
jgi:hypothetical protein